MLTSYIWGSNKNICFVRHYSKNVVHKYCMLQYIGPNIQNFDTANIISPA